MSTVQRRRDYNGPPLFSYGFRPFFLSGAIWAAAAVPLVAILHIGYGWLAPGLALLGLSILVLDFPRSSSLHALTAGAMGVMILAVMTRATRGHTGRPLTADRATLAIYVAVNLATVIRVAAPLWPSAQPALLGLGATLWALAFGGYAAVYDGMLAGRRR